MPYQIFCFQDNIHKTQTHSILIASQICNKCHPFCSCSICGGFLPNFFSGVGKCMDGICGGMI